MATRDRARLYAIHSGAVAAAYGVETGDCAMVGVGCAALEFAVG